MTVPAVIYTSDVGVQEITGNSEFREPLSGSGSKYPPAPRPPSQLDNLLLFSDRITVSSSFNNTPRCFVTSCIRLPWLPYVTPWVIAVDVRPEGVRGLQINHLLLIVLINAVKIFILRGYWIFFDILIWGFESCNLLRTCGLVWPLQIVVLGQYLYIVEIMLHRP